MTSSRAIRAATDGRGVDVIVDPVQGEVGARVRDLLVPDGRHVLCGHAGGLIAHDPHFYVRNHTLVGATLGGYSRRRDAAHPRARPSARSMRSMADGRYRPLVSRVVDFADVPAAITDLAERRTWGRVVVPHLTGHGRCHVSRSRADNSLSPSRKDLDARRQQLHPRVHREVSEQRRRDG